MLEEDTLPSRGFSSSRCVNLGIHTHTQEAVCIDEMCGALAASKANVSTRLPTSAQLWLY